MNDRFDLVVLGGGPGGYVAALRAADRDLRVALVEAGPIGGTCLNEGCIPSKALLHAAEVRTSSRGEIPGLPMPEESIDLAAVQGWKRNIVDRLRGGIDTLLTAAGVEVVSGYGRLAGAGSVRVDVDGKHRDLATAATIIATGSTPTALPSALVDHVKVLTSADALELEELPGRVTIIGAGYIGLELATALHGLGSEVVVVEATDRVLAGIHADCAAAVRDGLIRDGIQVRLSHQVQEINGTDVIATDEDHNDVLFSSDVVIVAVGRRPRTQDLGLGTVGLETDDRGFLPVDEFLRTGVDGVYALGDVTPGPALAHRASAQGKVVAEHLAGDPVRFEPAAVPAVVFTDPQLATVGLTVEQARERGMAAQEHRFPVAANARALVRGEGRGGAYIVTEAGTGLLLGVHLVGRGVDEVIGAAAIAIEMGAVLDDVADTILPHPTLSEVLGEAADVARGTPVHAMSGQGGR